jgi:TonB family protein
MRTTHRAGSLAIACLTLAVMLAGCVGDADTKKMAQVFAGSGGNPDQLPVMTNKQAPFRYPTAAYSKKIQGNTVLRIFIDADGNVQPDSTTVAEASGTPALDSAAIVGARELHFVPAKKNGQPQAISILFPVYWRHPDASPLPGDTILNRNRIP